MLDTSVRRPDPAGSPKIYQIRENHRYQVFDLASFGVHWHLSVGYRRPRMEEEHAGMTGLSENV